jgi:hypothetical protein
LIFPDSGHKLSPKDYFDPVESIFNSVSSAEVVLIDPGVIAFFFVSVL